MGYTLRQFRGYLDAAQRRERRTWRREVLGQAVAMSGGDALRKLLAELGRD